MSDRTFLDTNILVYSVDGSEPQKCKAARRVLGSSEYGTFVLSAQILGEFYAVVTRKLARSISEAEAAAAVESLGLQPVVPLDSAVVNAAIEISRSSQMSYWDGLVLAAASKAGCQRLLTEDLNHGQTVGSVRIENPFV